MQVNDSNNGQKEETDQRSVGEGKRERGKGGGEKGEGESPVYKGRWCS